MNASARRDSSTSGRQSAGCQIKKVGRIPTRHAKANGAISLARSDFTYSAAQIHIRLLVEGGIIRSNGARLIGTVDGEDTPLPGMPSNMQNLVDLGYASLTGQGFWVGKKCPECGGGVIPGFPCCQYPYE